MPPSHQGDTPSAPAHPHNVVSIDSTEAQRILADIRGLRRKVIDAWQERAVVLTPEEQLLLKDEIAYTCELLTLLTSRA